MTKEISTPVRNSSATVTPSFELDGSPPNKAAQLLMQRLETALRELSDLEATPEPTPKLYQKARRQNIQRMRINIADLKEALEFERKRAFVGQPML